MKNYKKNRYIYYSLTVYTIIVAGSFFVWEKMQQKLLSQRINAIREKTAKVAAENQRINMKIDRITSFDNIEEIGKKRFGLVTPDIAGVVTVQDDLKK